MISKEKLDYYYSSLGTMRTHKKIAINQMHHLNTLHLKTNPPLIQ